MSGGALPRVIERGTPGSRAHRGCGPTQWIQGSFEEAVDSQGTRVDRGKSLTLRKRDHGAFPHSYCTRENQLRNRSFNVVDAVEPRVCENGLIARVSFGSRCSGRSHCTVDVPDEDLHLQSPCPPDMMTYLEAGYQCVPGECCVHAYLHHTRTLTRVHSHAHRCCRHLARPI